MIKMAWRIDWKRIHNEWDKAPTELRETIKSLLKEMPYTELEKLFKQSPEAKAVYEKVIGRWVPPAEWSRELEKHLKDVFEATLTRGLPHESLRGISPKRYLPEFRLETPILKRMKTEEEMQKYVEQFATDILRREAKRPAVSIVRVPRVLRVPTPPYDEDEEPYIPSAYPEKPPVELPESPISPLPFPRAPSSEERARLYSAFEQELESVGIDPWTQMPTFNERITRWIFRNWYEVLEQFEELIEEIKTGKPVFGLKIPPMPWSEEKKRRDSIVHLTATKIYSTMEELLEVSHSYLFIDREPGIPPEEAKEYIKEAWKTKDIWFTSVSKEYLEALIGEKID